MDSDLTFSYDASGLWLPDETSLISQRFGIGGIFEAWCYDRHGNLRWHDVAKNIIPTAGLNDILNIYYGAGSQTATWYMGMVDNAGFSAFGATDTMGSQAGWAETVNTSLTSRPIWTPAAASAGSVSNGSAVTFNMNPSPTCTIRGFFICSNNTLGGTSGILSPEAALTSPQLCNNGDVLKVTYAVNATTS